MRPKISPSRNIARSLDYNEQKVIQQKAEFLTAGNFLKQSSHLSPEDKLHCFKRRMELNDKVSTSQHITLNFDPLDKLSNEQMTKIARLYMKEIGFERQPYLVYRHYDAGHPHCHIVTTHIRRDGSPIELYNIGRNQSEKARLYIEAEFGLITAEMKRQIWHQRQNTDGVQRVKYGEKSIAQSISRVLEHVTEKYKYTSLEDLNAILRLYNVEAYRGKEGSQLYQNRGLLYRVLDEHGKYIGVPLKASFFDSKPTLANLEKKFIHNLPLKEECRQHLINEIRWRLFQDPEDLEEFEQGLARENISLSLRRDKTGACQEVAYVDFRNRCVFQGHELDGYGDSTAIQNIIDREKALELERSLNQSEEIIHQYKHSLHL